MAGSWIKIESATAKRATQACVTLMISRTGKGSLFVSLPNTSAAVCGLENADTAELFFGDGDQAGKLWVKPADGGDHKVRKLAHTIAVKFDCPKGAALKANKENVDFEGQGKEGFVITLPAWAVPGSSPHVDKTEPGISAPKPGSLELNGNTLSLGKNTLALTKSEGIIVGELLKHFAKCLTKRQLLDALYQLDPNGGADDKIIDVWIHKLRKKLEERGFDISILTHRGLGYEMRRPVA